jgi:hypothetical protein
VVVLLGILGLSLSQEPGEAVYGAVGILAFGIVLLMLQRLAIWLRKRHDKSVEAREIAAVTRPST